MPITLPRPAASRRRNLSVFGLLLVAIVAPASAPGQAPDEATPGASTSRPSAEGLSFANGLLREGHHAQAAEEYERFLKDAKPGPEVAEAHFGLANARLFLGKNADARRHFEEFLNLAPSHPNAPTALFRTGETAYMLGDLPAARKALESYTSANAGHAYLETAWRYLGDVCFQLKDLPRARRAYDQAMVDFPEGRQADRTRFWLAQTMAAQGETEAALKMYAELAERKAPDWSDRARLEIGQLQAGMGQPAEAVATFEALEQASPQGPWVRQARLRRAEALTKLGRHDEAETLLRPLLADASPELATQAAYTLGSSQLERGRAADARAILDESYKKFPRSPMAPALLFRSAEASQKEGRADLARARYIKVAEGTPDDTWADDALLRAAGLALEAGDLTAARSQAASLATRYPKSPLLAEAHLIEAHAALKAKQPKAAIALLTGLLAHDRPTAEIAQNARYYLGLAYRADGQPDKAAEIIQALAKTPAAPVATDAIYVVGQNHFQAGRYEEAIPALEKYLAGKPNGDVADSALYYLAISHLERGEADAAAKAVDELANRFPRSKALGTARLRLAEAGLAGKEYSRAARLFRLIADGNDPALKPRALSGLGWTLIQDGKPAEAAQAFAARLAAAADDPLAAQDALARGRALEEAGQNDEALAAYAQVGERYAKTEQAGAATLARARLLAKVGRNDEAAQAFAAYVEDHGRGDKGEDLDAVLAEWGWALLDANKPADADRVFNRLMTDFPDSPKAADARLNLAESAYQAKNYDEVVRLLDPLVAEGSKADPLLIQSALYRLGRTCVSRKDGPGAARLFDRLLNAYPAGPFRREARFWKAEVAFQAGDPRAAEAEFAALAADPPPPGAEPDPWVQTARLRRVQSLVLLERWKDALEQADALKADLPSHPQKAEIDYARGRALQGLARFDEALAAYQAVIDARKNGDLAARAQFMRGETYFHNKNYDEARREFFKVDALFNAPTWQAAALLEAGKVYERLDQWDAAAEIYKKLREKFPGDPNAATAAQRLEDIRKRGDAPRGDRPAPADQAP